MNNRVARYWQDGVLLMLNWPKQRAWGWYATLCRTKWFCIKLLRFKPHGSLSMQRHKCRGEIWLFIAGVGSKRGGLYSKGTDNKQFETWHIRPSRWHQFISYDEPVYILELQYGKNVTEADIERK